MSAVLGVLPAKDLIQQALQEGGITIETKDDAGQLVLRTVLQLDGDVLFWATKPAVQSDESCVQLAERHWERVFAHLTELETALVDIGKHAQTWITRLRWSGLIGMIVGMAMAGTTTVSVTDIQKKIFWWALSLAMSAVGAAVRFLGPRIAKRVLLYYVKSWVAV